MYADTLSKSSKNLTRLLELLDYSQGYHFHGIRIELRQAVRDALHRANVDIEFGSSSLLYCLPKNEALKFDVQAYDVELRTLTEQHDLKKVNSHWTHRCENSMGMFQQVAKHNPHVGAFRPDGTLVAWMFRYVLNLTLILMKISNLRKENVEGSKGSVQCPKKSIFDHFHRGLAAKHLCLRRNPIYLRSISGLMCFFARIVIFICSFVVQTKPSQTLQAKTLKLTAIFLFEFSVFQLDYWEHYRPTSDFIAEDTVRW